MKWKKIRKIIWEHPYLLDDTYTLSRTDAAKIFDAGFPTFEEMIAAAKSRTNAPAEDWKYFDEIIAKRRRKQAFKSFIRVFVQKVYFKRAIVGFVIALIIGFFTLFPTGRALAKSIFDIVVRFVRSGLVFDKETFNGYMGDSSILTNEPNPSRVAFDTTQYTSFNSLEEFENVSGLSPVFIDADTTSIESIEFEANADAGYTLTTIYRTAENKTIVVKQTWNMTSGTFMAFNNAMTFELPIFINCKLICTVDSLDGSFFGAAVLDDSTLTIGMEREINYESITKSIKRAQKRDVQ